MNEGRSHWRKAGSIGSSERRDGRFDSPYTRNWTARKNYDRSKSFPLFCKSYQNLAGHIMRQLKYIAYLDSLRRPSPTPFTGTAINCQQTLNSIPPGCSLTNLLEPDILRLLPERLTGHVQAIFADETGLLLVASDSAVFHVAR
jgi:hypothetical protein